MFSGINWLNNWLCMRVVCICTAWIAGQTCWGVPWPLGAKISSKYNCPNCNMILVACDYVSVCNSASPLYTLNLRHVSLSISGIQFCCDQFSPVVCELVPWCGRKWSRCRGSSTGRRTTKITENTLADIYGDVIICSVYVAITSSKVVVFLWAIRCIVFFYCNWQLSCT